MASVKKIIYFLLACNENGAAQFLCKYNYYIEDNRRFPVSFIKRSKFFFKRNKKQSYVIKENQFLLWKHFCRNSNYEQVLPIVLFGILKYPKEQISWFLKIPPENLSYRLEEGLLILGEELMRTSYENINNKEIIFAIGSKEKKKQKALAYCNWLAEQVLPDVVEQVVPKKKYKKATYLLFGFLFMAFLAFFIWILVLMFFPSAKVILYQSFLDKNF